MGGQAVLPLGAADHVEGVVGGEDDAHVPGVVALFHLVGESGGVGGGGVAQLVDEGLDDVLVALAALFPDLGVGADGEAVQGDGALLGPLGEGLGEEVERGDEEENEPVGAGDLLGDLEAGEGLAGAAGHDELAAVGLLEAEEDLGLGALLMGAQGLFGLQCGGGSGLAGLELGPVDLGVLEVVEVDLADGRLLVGEGGLGVVAPVVGGGDDEAAGEAGFAGGGEEAVDVGFPHAVVGRVAFALDGVVFPGAAGAGDEVDAGVLGGDAELGGADLLGPIGEEPDLGVEVGVAGLVAEVGADEFLEVGALLLLGLGGGAVGGEDGFERGHGFGGRGGAENGS